MSLYSCTGFNQYGTISGCTTGLNASSSTGHIYYTSNYSSNYTSISSGASTNLLVDCSRLCTSVNYDFAVSGSGYINSYLCYFLNGNPRINNLGGTVSVNYPMSCSMAMAKVSDDEADQDDISSVPIQVDDPDEAEFSKINTIYFNLLEEIKEAGQKGAQDNEELKDRLINNVKDYKNFIKKHPQSSLASVALTTAANSFSLLEDNNGMKSFLDEIINEKELASLKGKAGILMIDYYSNIEDFEKAISSANASIDNYKNESGTCQ